MGVDMVGTKPEHWRVLTPIFGVLNFLGVLVVGIVGWFLIRTVEQFDKHLESIDAKFEAQNKTNFNFEHRITLIQGQCCKRSLTQVDENGG